MATVRLFLVFVIFTFVFDSIAQNTKEISRPEIIQSTITTDIKTLSDYKGDLCVPEYSSGCDAGDGFTDFAVAEIENYGSGCEDNMGFDGWSQYLELGPAVLLPGQVYDFIMQTGYDDQFVTIWIDFNDDYILSPDEKIMTDFSMEEAGQFYTAQATIPPDALIGQHYMRARTNWTSSCNDPCTNYSYGEAEDYLVIIGNPSFGEIEGVVSELASGNPITGATVTLTGLFNYTMTTGSDGTYSQENIMVGDYELECFKESYNVITTTITIEEDIVLTQNFQLTQPDIGVSPTSLVVVLEPNSTTEETITIENNGNGPMDWSASMLIVGDNSKDFLDLQFDYPTSGGNGEAGIESDGQYIYTTKWNGNEFFQYDLDGTYLGSFTISGVSTIRDMAYDGTYFYGGTASTTVYELDFETQTLASVITAPTVVRALAYNESEEVFYGNNWDTPVVKFDITGNNLGSFNVGPIGGSYYGFAYDQATVGGPYLWGYAQIGASNNEIIQLQLPSGTETGLSFDVTDKLSGQLWGDAGGLFTQPNLIYGKWTLGGIVQNERIWGLELTDAQTWLGVSPNGGTLPAGESEELTVLFDATGLMPGAYDAEIYFTSVPDVGNPVVDVSLLIEGMVFPCNLQSNVNCTNVELQWEMCPPGGPNPDSFNVYRNDEVIASVVEMMYTDSLLLPEIAFEYKITALFGGDESLPCLPVEVAIPLPADLEPTNLILNLNGNIITLSWDPPDGCLIPESYNIYRDGNLIGISTETTYQSEVGGYEFFVTAVYYIGESEPSNTVIITDIRNDAARQIQIFPNPAKDQVNINSPFEIYKLEILNNLGLSILNDKVTGKEYQLNVSYLSPGIYFLRIEAKQETTLQKVLIQ